MSSRVLRTEATLEFVGLKSRDTLYQRIRRGIFTPGIPLGVIRQNKRPSIVGWPERELAAINEARIAGKSDEEIRELVRDLVARRKSAVALVAA